ncbi:MAG: DUF4118 domain-containing protein [Deltaproteobacteria bacterium]|nr:MAG: DUF4118 domain-containing protein [Deltaproteobacteria bacterium]
MAEPAHPQPSLARALRSPWLGVVLLLAAITAGHYTTDTAHAVGHDLFRRLYYLPIVWAAFTGGLVAGLTTALVAIIAYVPHAFLMPHHLDPAGTTDKVLEIVLYLGVGGLAGLLVDRERRARDAAERDRLERLAAEQDTARLQGLVQLTRGLAHEVRNPLGSIHGAIEILASAIPPSDPSHEMATIAQRETTRLSRVLDDFLAFARPRDPDLARFDPTRAVEHVTALLQDAAAGAGVTLTGSADPGLTCVGDLDQVIQVLVNLVMNALEATPAGGRVEVHAVAAPGGVRFAVRDTGPGVPEDLAAAIYDPYFTTRDDGSGLGLSVAALLVSQQGGLLAHDAHPGGGADFHFDLPAGGADG